MTRITRSPKETKDFAARIAGKLKGGEIIALSGSLGAGKTVFVKGLARGLGIPERGVRSPSFVILTEHHQGRLPLFHFDFYRFRSGSEINTTPFEDCLKAGGIIVIEWPERVKDYLPEKSKWIKIEILGPRSRRITKLTLEMLQIISDKRLLKKLKAGHDDAKKRRGKFVRLTSVPQ